MKRFSFCLTALLGMTVLAGCDQAKSIIKDAAGEASEKANMQAREKARALTEKAADAASDEVSGQKKKDDATNRDVIKGKDKDKDKDDPDQ